MSKQLAYRDRVAAYFKDRPGHWIDGMALEPIGGKYAWRSRVSDCRLELGMVIENKQLRQTDTEGRRWTTSLYRYVPESAPVQASKAHDLNGGFELR